MSLKPVILILSASALPLARQLQSVVGGAIHGFEKRLDAADCDVIFADVSAHVRQLFTAGTPIIAVMASGALIRLLAPVLTDKQDEPAVIAIADDGSAVVPLLGGHHGANDLARVIAAVLDIQPAITTAGDVRFGIALDAPPEGYVLANPQNAKAFMADLIAGAKVQVSGEASWLTQSSLPIVDKADHKITVTENISQGSTNELVYHPKSLVLGVGCERGAEPAELIALAEQTLADNKLSGHSVALVCSLDVKADEGAVHAIATHYSVEARFFDAARLEQEAPRLQNPSEIVFAEVGCHGVSEGAALAASGASGALIVPKQKSARATVAIGKSAQPMDNVQNIGRKRGTLFVVGIGPGKDDWRSPEVTKMVAQSTDLVGYSLYLDILGQLTHGKIRHDFPLGREEDRVRHAMELAGEGRDVALVCSGDAGIYAMATLVFELLEKGSLSDSANRIEIAVSPGISALQAAAAKAGAPLGHDFCTISLSDLLTPWESIKMRVKAAAEGDFVIAFYNPVSIKRRTQLAYARDVLLEHRPHETPVILATNLGRTGELVRIVPLGALNIDDVDMLTVVIVGSSESRVVKTGDGRAWVYTPRGYSGKTGTGMN